MVENTSKSVRNPLCRYYSANKAELEKEIGWCYQYFKEDQNVTKPGSIPILLVPHGAYCDSGPLAAHAFKSCIKASSGTIILIGTEHASSSQN